MYVDCMYAAEMAWWEFCLDSWADRKASDLDSAPLSTACWGGEQDGGKPMKFMDRGIP